MAFTSDKISPSTQRKMARVLELLTSLKTKMITSEPLSQTERRLYWATGSTLESLAGCIEQLKNDLTEAENLTKPNIFQP